MLRMANVYWEEGSLENAYILYMKYMTLFLEKIRSHPEYATVSSDWKIQTQAKIREVLPKAEKIKQKLLEQYTLQYNRYSQELVSSTSLKLARQLYVFHVYGQLYIIYCI